MSKLKIYIVEKGAVESISQSEGALKLQEILLQLQKRHILEPDSYTVMFAGGDVVSPERNVLQLAVNAGQYQDKKEDIFVFSRKSHLQQLRLPELVQEWPLPTEDNPETLQHLMTPMTAPSKLVVGHIEILHFEKQFYDTFMRAKDIYSEFYSKFHFIQEVLDMLEMKTRGETVSKRSLQKFFIKKHEQLSKFQKSFVFEANKCKKMLDNYDSHFRELGSQPIDDRLVPLLNPKFQQFPRPSLSSFLSKEHLESQKGEWLQALGKYEGQFQQLRDIFDRFELKLRSEFSEQRLSMPKSAIQARKSCQAIISADGENLEQLMTYLYLQYKKFREHLESILHSKSPDAGLESLRPVVQDAKQYMGAFISKLPSLQNNIMTIRYITEQVAKDAKIQHEGLNETLRSLSLLGKSMKSNCFKPQKDLEQKAQQLFQSFTSLERPWKFKESYNATIQELRRRSHFHKFIRYVVEKVSSYLKKQQEKRLQFMKENGLFLPDKFIPGLFSAPPVLNLQPGKLSGLVEIQSSSEGSKTHTMQMKQIFEDTFEDIVKLFSHSRIQQAESLTEKAKELYKEEANKNAKLEQNIRDLKAKLAEREKNTGNSSSLKTLVEQLQEELEVKNKQIAHLNHKMRTFTQTLKIEVPQQPQSQFFFQDALNEVIKKYLEVSRQMVRAKELGTKLLKQRGPPQRFDQSIHEEQVIRFLNVELGDTILFYCEPNSSLYRAFVKGKSIGYYLEPDKYPPKKDTKPVVGRVIRLLRQIAGDEKPGETMIPLEEATNYYLVDIERQ